MKPLSIHQLRRSIICGIDGGSELFREVEIRLILSQIMVDLVQSFDGNNIVDATDRIALDEAAKLIKELEGT